MVIIFSMAFIISIISIALCNMIKYHLFNIGTYYPFFFSLQIILMWFSNLMQWLYVFLKILLLIQIVVFIILTIMMIGIITCRRVDEKQSEGTVIVLGCYAKDEEPGRILQSRLDSATNFLQQHLNYNCIVSGGQGPNEQYKESSVMANYLRRCGVESKRIYQESCSHTTRENLLFSLQIIAQENLSDQVIIVSSEFHLYRAYRIWRKLSQCRCRLLLAKTPFIYQQTYWVREWFAILTNSRQYFSWITKLSLKKK